MSAPPESAKQGTRIRSPCLKFACSDSLDNRSEQLCRLAGDAVLHVVSVAGRLTGCTEE